MQGSVCVNERCGYRQKGEHRDCPRCGWLMLDGPLPAPGSIAPPPRVLDVKAIGAAIGAASVLFVGAIGLIAGSFATSDPTAHASPAVAHAPAAPVAAPAVHTETLAPAATPAPIATPAAVAAAAPASVAKKTTATKAPTKKSTVAKKKAPAKKTAKKTVARR